MFLSGITSSIPVNTGKIRETLERKYVISTTILILELYVFLFLLVLARFFSKRDFNRISGQLAGYESPVSYQFSNKFDMIVLKQISKTIYCHEI